MQEQKPIISSPLDRLVTPSFGNGPKKPDIRKPDSKNLLERMKRSGQDSSSSYPKRASKGL